MNIQLKGFWAFLSRYTDAFVFAFVYIFTLKQMGLNNLKPLIPIYMSSLFAYMIIFFLIKKRLIALTLALTLITFLFANVIHFRYFEGPLQVSSLLVSSQAAFVLDYIVDLGRKSDAIYLVSFLISAVFIWIRGGRRSKVSIKTAGVIIALFLVTTGLRFYVAIFPQYNINKNIRSIIKPWDKTYSTNWFGFIPTIVHDSIQIVKRRGWGETINARATFKLSKLYNELSEYPNLILIQVESLEFDIIGKRHDNIEITPFLNSLKKRALFFSNFYAQHTPGGGTSDADFSILTSMYPPGNIPPFYSFGLENLVSFPFVLNTLGYETAAFHTNFGGFWGRSTGFKKLGLKRFYTAQNYSGNSRLEDAAFFDRSMKYMKSLRQPFMAYLLTISSHGSYSKPFFISEDKLDKSITVPDDRQAELYFRLMAYVDSSLKSLFAKIEKTFDNYILVIYGDHTAGLKGSVYSSNKVYGFEEVPLFIYASDGSLTGVNDKLSSNFDIPSTLLALIKVARPESWVGIDLLCETRNTLYIHSTSYSLNSDKTFNLITNNDNLEPMQRIHNYIK